jgi:peptidoglycan/xylan/chitin deacetylase (PgdA/CDA1 family)
VVAVSLVPEDLREISRSGPADRGESERAIRGYVEILSSYGLPATLLVHPEVAGYHADLLLDYEQAGHCLGLHLHPYKLGGGGYRRDLGAYPAEEQRRMIGAACRRWKEIIGCHPQFFRAGYFSANDTTFGVLEDLGFQGGSVSIPGRILLGHQSVWAGAEDYPHRADRAFRLSPGGSSFVEVPVSVDYGRPVIRGAAGEIGFEWPYIASLEYDSAAVVTDILERFREDKPATPVFVMDVHNDQPLDDPEHPCPRNLRLILDTLRARAREHGAKLTALTLRELCPLVRSREKAEGKRRD